MTVAIFNLIDIHILSIAVILTVLAYCFHSGETKTRQQKMFILIIAMTFISIITEFPSLFELKNFYYLAYWCEGISYITTPMIAYVWVLYVYTTVNTNQEKFKTFALFSFIPALINTVLVLINPWTNLNYTMDANIVLARGPFYYVIVAVAAFYMLFSFYMIIKFRFTTGKYNTEFLMIFAILPIIGATLQTLFFGTNPLWISLSIGILILYLNIQSTVLKIDFLTKVNNRRSFEQYLDNRLESRTDQIFSIFMMDVDDFKEINDTYGHQIGDEALRQTALTLRHVFGNASFISRYGGDEFIVITYEIMNETKAVKIIDEALLKFNINNDTFKLALSVGGQICDQSKYVQSEELLKILDAKMYAAKRAKIFKRRETDIV